MSKRFLANVTIDHDLLLEFFLTFARFEFALKATGFWWMQAEVINGLRTLRVVFSLFNLVCAIALFQWKKWGFWGFCVSSVVLFVVNLSVAQGISSPIVGLGGVLLLYGVLHIGKENKGWPQLE